MEEIYKERFFSVELKSNVNPKNVTVRKSGLENVLVEGTIGELVQAEFAHDMILVVTGKRGIFRINLTRIEIKKKQEK